MTQVYTYMSFMRGNMANTQLFALATKGLHRFHTVPEERHSNLKCSVIVLQGSAALHLTF